MHFNYIESVKLQFSMNVMLPILVYAYYATSDLMPFLPVVVGSFESSLRVYSQIGKSWRNI